MRRIKNACVNCKDEWVVNINLNHTKLDDTDKTNISNHGQLFSICEDCNDGECESVLV